MKDATRSFYHLSVIKMKHDLVLGKVWNTEISPYFIENLSVLCFRMYRVLTACAGMFLLLGMLASEPQKSDPTSAFKPQL